MTNKLIILSVVAFISSCSIMPYQEESNCKYNDFGRCIPIDKAYEESLTGKYQGGTQINGDISDDKNTANNNSQAKSKTNLNDWFSSWFSGKDEKDLKNKISYQSTLYDKQKQLLKSSKTPLLEPAVVRRVLIMPYKNKESNVWYEARKIYYIEKQPRWILDDISIQTPKENNFNLFQ